MEKSQWDLKKIRFQHRRLTRLDDSVHTYKVMHQAIMREYQDSVNTQNKIHRVDVERWKQKKQQRRGVYVSPMTKPFDFEKQKEQKVLKKKTAVRTELQNAACHQSEATLAKEQRKSTTTNVPLQLETEGPDNKNSTSLAADAPPPFSTQQNSALDSTTENNLLGQDKRLSIELSSSFTVMVWKADLTTFVADTIVNAANENLQHYGGLALALCKAGGQDIVEESDLHIQKHGKLKTGEAIVTNAGNLLCKKIIHAVGPRVKKIHHMGLCVEPGRL
ncbi:uncharacterized protein LOC132961603 [Labrus mixtus]|uniref:uncharacterized protein LOC132961603 n=1 Tax=Labrus mixtus TaxID=508554 RepID=UPI0029C09740|nr:uncharacterized protein LOC132961603 [Labrus mixtus]